MYISVATAVIGCTVHTNSKISSVNMLLLQVCSGAPCTVIERRMCQKICQGKRTLSAGIFPQPLRGHIFTFFVSAGEERKQTFYHTHLDKKNIFSSPGNDRFA